MNTVAIIGTLDSKGEEFAYLKQIIEENGAVAKVIDIGTKGPALFTPDYTAEDVASYGGEDLDELRASGIPAKCMEAEAKGLPLLMKNLLETGQIQCVISMGGGQGSSVIRACYETLPIGFPKLLVSTMAGAGDRLLYGIGDTLLIDSVVDFSGLNDILKPIIANAGAAAAGMANRKPVRKSSRKRIAVSMFGQTTDCVDRVRKLLAAEGYDVYPFHANGMGGKKMENLIRQGYFDLVMDITLTEILQDMVIPGSGNISRLKAACETGIPQIIAPGALDNINVFHLEKDRFSERKFMQHNAEVFLMRALPEEEISAAEIIASRLNMASGPVCVMLPMGGFSRLSTMIPDAEADKAFADTLKSKLREDIPIIESDAMINSDEFAQMLCKKVQEMLTTEEKES